MKRRPTADRIPAVVPSGGQRGASGSRVANDVPSNPVMPAPNQHPPAALVKPDRETSHARASFAGPDRRPLRLPRTMLADIVAHLRSELPNEGCGLLAADDAEPTTCRRFYPGQNVDRSPHRFTMDAGSVIDALRDIDGQGWRLAAIVHSHPAGPATPSATDVREAHYPDAALLIVGFASGEPIVQAWRLAADAGPFVEVPVIALDDATAPEPGDTDLPGAAARAGAFAGDDARLLDELATFPAALEHAVHHASADALRRPGSDGGWGAIEHLAHLRDWEEVTLGRIVAVLEHDEPTLPAFDDGLWDIERDYRSRRSDQVLAEFSSLRREAVAAARTGGAAGLERGGVHGIHGRITLRWLLTSLHAHGADHLRQIRDALA